MESTSSNLISFPFLVELIDDKGIIIKRKIKTKIICLFIRDSASAGLFDIFFAEEVPRSTVNRAKISGRPEGILQTPPGGLFTHSGMNRNNSQHDNKNKHRYSCK
jgi:hypothetical protein